jgi:hypothetical protein
MKLQKTFSLIVLTVAILAGMSRIVRAQTATAQLPLLDDFSTGKYQKTLTSGLDQNVQTGNRIIGGQRYTYFCVSKPCSGQTNPYGQAGSFQIAAPSGLIFSTGYKVLPRLLLGYGYSASLNLPLAPTYDRLRLSFDGNNAVTNLLIYAWSGNTNESGLSCHISPNPNPFTLDLRFVDFKRAGGTGADFTNISAMALVFTEDFITGGNDWAITRFEATNGDAGAVICH